MGLGFALHLQYELIKVLGNNQVTKLRVYKIMALKFDRKLNNNNCFLSKPTMITARSKDVVGSAGSVFLSIYC